MGQRLVRALEGRLPEGQSARHLLPLLSKVISLVPASLNEGKGENIKFPANNVHIS